ncbi:hypothetical protein NA56DRAFT_702899 [Hyaloscypha hepaticicola]|uniref:Uncharacterized protein n=1 Tax=Hyaloscypha hepaticicola TaxID=2082293 RepID=A0A2J6Q6S8_9HELO|nr:hypothetical protein NA56DRAFT_702899 [Hyaloscypha hepaticicola]
MALPESKQPSETPEIHNPIPPKTRRHNTRGWLTQSIQPVIAEHVIALDQAPEEEFG